MVAGIIGATGYAGAELTRLLSGHPEVKKLVLSSVSFEGGRIEDVYPGFLGIITGDLLKAEDVINSSDVVFSALPHAVGEHFAAACMEKGVHYIDLSADFRFDDDEKVYAAWYGKNYQFPELHKKSVYGLPELNRQKIKELSVKPLVVGNPGCYPTGASLGVFPAVSKALGGSPLCDLASPIIINAVSGTSGGGREPSRSFHYSECADSIAPYKVASHRHSPEIARNISKMAEKALQVIFTPHLAPMNRGILSTIYIALREEWRIKAAMFPSKEMEDKTAEIRSLYENFYKDEPFVRVLPQGLFAATNRVRHSNYCDISVHIDLNGSTLIVTTAIDNMIKGAAGQAIQNMNILLGFNEKSGLEAIPMVF
ncbi:MAG: N-acetyl-gamma-glutamyl-phosphate reductase [Treponema sp.]|nr:N-acetyl-gamma-glutamyl-phosphate reductase [Treponema sp.]